MLLIDILKLQGMFANDIRGKLKSGAVKINSEPVSTNIDIDFDTEKPVMDYGDFVFQLCMDGFFAHAKIFGVENMASDEETNMNSEYSRFMSQFIIIRASKREIFVLTRKVA